MQKPRASVCAGVGSTYSGGLQLMLNACIWDNTLFNTLLFALISVVGVAKHIDWFGPSGDRIEPNRPDITVTRNDESSSTLTLYKAGTENAGTYKCVATNGDQQGESTVKVKIFRKYFPHIPNYWAVWTQEKKESCLLNSQYFIDCSRATHYSFSFQVRMDFSSVQ